MDHETGISNFGISFTPADLTYNYAYLDRVGGENDTVIYQSLYTGLGVYPATPSNVSYATYTWDSNGNPQEPTFDVLPLSGYRYWLNQMVVMGDLPKTSSGVGDPVNVYTYGVTQSTDEKLVSGATYWKTNVYDTTQYTYSTMNAVGNNYTLADGENYMVSFTLTARYSAPIYLYVWTTNNSTITAYINSNESIFAYPDKGRGSYGEDEVYDFYIPKPATVQAILLKINARTTSYTVPTYRWYGYCMLDGVRYDVTKQMCDQMAGTWHTGYSFNGYATAYKTPYFNLSPLWFDGESGIFVQQNNAETLYQYPLTSGYVQEVVIGSGFNATTTNDRMNAQMPPDARVSMNQAANTDPTKNKVFYVTLLLEKLTQQYDEFRGAVKTMIYDTLNYTINIGTFSFTECKIAKWVWRIMDNWGFGAVDRIINFFKSSDMQNRLANVVMNDTQLQTDLNYNGASGTLNYFGVAHVGILIFADWIFKTYIQSNSFLYKTWKWIMGIAPSIFQLTSSSTLVDVVNLLWNVGSNAIQTVKDAATKFVEGVKAAGQFISNTVVQAILDGIKSGMVNVLQAMFLIFKSAFPNANIYTIPNGVHFIDIDIVFSSVNKDLTLQFGGTVLNFGNILLNKAPVESLGLLPDFSKYFGNVDANGLLIGGIQLIATKLILTLLPASTDPMDMVSLVATYIGSLILQIFLAIQIAKNIYSTNNEILRRSMIEFYKVNGFINIALTIFGKWSETEIGKGHTGTGYTYSEAFELGGNYIKGLVSLYAIMNALMFIFGIINVIQLFEELQSHGNIFAMGGTIMTIFSVISTYEWKMPLPLVVYNVLLSAIFFGVAYYLSKNPTN